MDKTIEKQRFKENPEKSGNRKNQKIRKILKPKKSRNGKNNMIISLLKLHQTFFQEITLKPLRKQLFYLLNVTVKRNPLSKIIS